MCLRSEVLLFKIYLCIYPFNRYPDNCIERLFMRMHNYPFMFQNPFRCHLPRAMLYSIWNAHTSVRRLITISHILKCCVTCFTTYFVMFWRLFDDVFDFLMLRYINSFRLFIWKWHSALNVNCTILPSHTFFRDVKAIYLYIFKKNAFSIPKCTFKICKG